ncbi:MAG: hypothetical protein ACNA7K_02070 [Acholeplasmataceae bacterium]
MTVKRNIQTLLYILSLVSLLFACSNGDSKEPATSSPIEAPIETPSMTEPTHQIPQNLSYAYHLLSWESVLTAEYYTIKIGDHEYQVESTSFVIKDLPNGTYLASVRANSEFSSSPFSESIEILVEIDQDNPSLITAASMTFGGTDMVFIFNLLGAQFLGLSGNNITSNDYHFSDDTLIINPLFVEQILNENPDRKSVILSYQIQLDDDFIVGYLFINIES